MKSWIAGLLMLISAASFAAPEAWMVKSGATTLAYMVSVAPECPVTAVQITELTEDLLIRSGLTPTNSWHFEHKLFLRAKVECVEFRSEEYAFVTTVGVGNCHNGRTVFEWYDTGNLGVVTVDREAFILDSLKEGIEKALADYLKANFDLAPT